MLTAVLIARPDHLSDATVTGLASALQGSALRWLSPGEAAEFSLPARPAEFDATRATLLAEGIDLNLVPTATRRKKMLLADMDSTMIGQECIDELADMAGVGPRVADITARAMNGELDFEAALKERVGLLKDLPETVIAQVLAERITYTPGGRALIATMKRDGGYAALVSGGFTAFTAAVAAHLGFDENRANTLLAQNGRLTGEVALPILGRQAKIDALDQITARLALSDQDVIAVGDGANDLGMLGRAGFGVALHAKPAVAAQCDLRIHHGDLSALLFLQGYARSDFAA
ncbi:phosphoserine phosphatase SerB [Falsigemmobacter faecalis]|uniref:Phosphoserine phosphatase n=1 Tax=Falsigemmobacter faecalis TaxID=2488730 RepID=A0A3P3DA15_9RHOB|nr:phosphoserine phosphatase SerB [Falsigemmobacter faecalis]RRH69228.1 phosphoserine phosphatase SerB [Falsigemmobacter faecalis]